MQAVRELLVATADLAFPDLANKRPIEHFVSRDGAIQKDSSRANTRMKHLSFATHDPTQLASSSGGRRSRSGTSALVSASGEALKGGAQGARSPGSSPATTSKNGRKNVKKTNIAEKMGLDGGSQRGTSAGHIALGSPQHSELNIGVDMDLCGASAICGRCMVAGNPVLLEEEILGIRAAFLRCLVSIFRNYRKFILTELTTKAARGSGECIFVKNQQS